MAEGSRDVNYNKDFAFLMELQRLEICANNFAMEGNHPQRLTALKCWFNSIYSELTAFERVEGKVHMDQCAPFTWQGQTRYDTDNMDALHQFLASMNETHNLQLTKKAGAESAAFMGLE